MKKMKKIKQVIKNRGEDFKNKCKNVVNEIQVRSAMICGDNRGIGVVEVILILVVLIGVVVIFRDQITAIVNSVFERISSETSGI